MAELTQEFINLAQDMQKKTGIPASITLAQLIKESSGKFPGGLSGLAYNDKNLFGVKGKGTAGTVYYPSPEFENGKYVVKESGFRKYNSYEEAFEDRAIFLSGPRYQNAFKGANSVNDYAEGLQNAKYATNPNYAKDLLQTIEKHDLHKYDTGNYSFTPVGGVVSLSNGGLDGSKGLTGDLIFTINRIVLILLFLILGVVFFLKAFPSVDNSIANPANLLNPVKKIKTVGKVAKVIGGK